MKVKGAAGDDPSRDDTPALQSALFAAIEAGEWLELDNKAYYYSQLYAPVRGDRVLKIRGQGCNVQGLGARGAGTRLICRGPENGFGINVHPAEAVNTWGVGYFKLADFSLLRDGLASTTRALRIGREDGMLTGNSLSTVESVRIDGFHRGIDIVNAREVAFDHVSVMAPGAGAHVPLHIETTGYFVGDLDFDDCRFTSNGDPAGSRSVVIAANGPHWGAHGIHFTDCVLYYGETGFQLYASQGGTIGDLFLTKCAFEGATWMDPDAHNAFHATAQPGSSISGVAIQGGYMVGWRHHGAVFHAAPGGRIVNCSVEGVYLGQCGRGAVSFDGVQACRAECNRLFDIGVNGDLDPGQVSAIRIVNSQIIDVMNNSHWANPYHGCRLGHIVEVGEGCDVYEVDGNKGHCTVSPVLDRSGAGNRHIGPSNLRLAA